MEQKHSDIPNESVGLERANTIAAELIASSSSHDEFFQKMTQRGVQFPSDPNFNNFPARLAEQKGYALSNFVEFAGLLSMPVDAASLKAENFHSTMEDLLSNEKKGHMEDKGMPESIIASAINELHARKIALRLEKEEGRPDYCAVGNLELKNKYKEKDSAARQFVFECAKALMLEGKRFYEDIWQ